MRCLIVLVALFGASLALHTKLGHTRIYENQLNKTMFCVRDLLNKGKPEIGLPSFDPLVLHDVTLDFDNLGMSFIKGKLVFKKFTFTDTAKFALTAIEGEHVDGALDFHVVTEWPVSSFEGQYEMDFNVFGTTVKGKGTISETITDYGSDIKFRASLPLFLEKLNIRVFMKGFEFHIDELIVNGENITEDINVKANKGVEWLEENTDLVDAATSSFVMQVVNGITGDIETGGPITKEFITCWENSA